MNKSEEIVFLDLKERGFVVSSPKRTGSENGHDLVAIKNGQAILIEVKPVVLGTKSKRIKPVLSSGKTADWIAMVHGKDIIYQPMSDHLRCCSKAGTRGVTALLQLRKMILIESGSLK